MNPTFVLILAQRHQCIYRVSCEHPIEMEKVFPCKEYEAQKSPASSTSLVAYYETTPVRSAPQLPAKFGKKSSSAFTCRTSGQNLLQVRHRQRIEVAAHICRPSSVAE